jgi:hypothetical protein
MKQRKPITLPEAPAFLSKWRHLRKTGVVSDRELWGALNACVERLNEMGAFDVQSQDGKSWAAEEQRKKG